jgi:2-polyprenyl-6-methoxyphenol hydroxylase-like FAD-dependent oxidoreductase
MSATTSTKVTIIGAGLAGLTLALALHDEGITVQLYESRPAPLNIGGAVMLSPNALRILDALHIYEELKPKGFSFQHLDYRDLTKNLEVTEVQEFGNETKYGYDGLRIYRHEVIDALTDALRTKNIPVAYGRKFSHIVSDTTKGVIFAFADGTTETTELLVGADGIHSTVRRHLYPELEPKFIGMAGITAAVPTSQLALPADFHIPVTITSPRGGFVIAPQRVDGSEVLIGKQQRLEAGTEPDWDRAFVADKEGGMAFLQQGNEAFPEIVQRATSHIDPAKVNKWPFFVVPRLDKWTSDTRKVIIVGDAAHAIPPSAGQGINQAFEDVYMLALLLGQGDKVKDQRAALTFWQEYRQGRVDRVLELNKQIDLRRMPTGDGVGSMPLKEFDLNWLYKPDFKADVAKWIDSQEGV